MQGASSYSRFILANKALGEYFKGLPLQVDTDPLVVGGDGKSKSIFVLLDTKLSVLMGCQYPAGNLDAQRNIIKQGAIPISDNRLVVMKHKEYL